MMDDELSQTIVTYPIDWLPVKAQEILAETEYKIALLLTVEQYLDLIAISDLDVEVAELTRVSDDENT